MRTMLLLPLLLLACAPRTSGVQGGELVSYNQFTRKADRVYTAGGCRDRRGAPVEGAEEVEYELHQGKGKTEFIEHALSEEQARVLHNRWQDADGVHYFVWLADVRGFEYVLPTDPSKAALRRVYRDPRVQKVKLGGASSVRPLGTPDIICDLVAMK